MKVALLVSLHLFLFFGFKAYALNPLYNSVNVAGQILKNENFWEFDEQFSLFDEIAEIKKIDSDVFQLTSDLGCVVRLKIKFKSTTSEFDDEAIPVVEKVSVLSKDMPNGRGGCRVD